MRGSGAPDDGTRTDGDALRAAVSAYARRLRDSGEPPPGMLVRVKEAVGRVPMPIEDGTSRQRVMDAVVRWSIDAYYADR